MRLIFKWLLIVWLCVPGSLSAQITPAKLRQFIRSGIADPCQSSMEEFYAVLDYQSAWLQPQAETSRNALFDLLKNAGSLGLEEKDYGFEFIRSLQAGHISLISVDDSLIAEVKLTNAALCFFHDLLYGNIAPALGYNGLNYTPSCFNIPVLVANHIITNTLDEIMECPYDLTDEIKALRLRIAWIHKILNSPGFSEERISSAIVNTGNKPLLKKLFYLGLIDSAGKKMTDKELKAKVKEAQRQFDLLADGVLRSTALQAFNIPLTERLKQLKLSINYYRWLYALRQQEPVIVVNIPAAYLKVYYQCDVILEMRMIVGKPSTPTPTLSSRLSEVILYPYWMVPNSIATKELLPLFQRNPGFVDAGNYQVLSKQGKIINHNKVDWSSVSAKNFPYIIRQSTGCDNALGVIKFDFYSPYTVYLHDTPAKSLFMLNKRYFSHGCMRLEKPIELGHLVLKNNQIAIDTLEEKGCLRNQAPIKVKVDQAMPVIVWYNPAGVDSTGRVIYYEDVYRKFTREK